MLFLLLIFRLLLMNTFYRKIGRGFVQEVVGVRLQYILRQILRTILLLRNEILRLIEIVNLLAKVARVRRVLTPIIMLRVGIAFVGILMTKHR